MADARLPALVVVALLAGYGLAGAAHTAPSDACAHVGSLPESSSSSSRLERWPLGVRCEYFGTSTIYSRAVIEKFRHAIRAALATW